MSLGITIWSTLYKFDKKFVFKFFKISQIKIIQFYLAEFLLLWFAIFNFLIQLSKMLNCTDLYVWLVPANEFLFPSFDYFLKVKIL